MGTFKECLGAKVELVTGPGVNIESEAVRQLNRVADLPGCVRAVGMPDLHPGPGIPIGMVNASASFVHPTLVGSDAGCGVTMAIAGKVVAPSKRLRRIEAATDDPPPLSVDPIVALEAAWTGGAPGLAACAGMPQEFAEWVRNVPWGHERGESGPLPDALREARFGQALGTAGGGNHFLELASVDKVLEDDALPGLRRGVLVVVAHSGSRGLGKALVDRWSEHPLSDPNQIARYMGELAGCCRFAQANRALLVWRMLEAIGAARADRIPASLDIVHNDVSPLAGEDSPWIHRKGAAPARAGELTLTLGSRGTASWILRGRGSEAHLCSIAHGAGRKIPRTESKARLSRRYKRTQLRKTTGGADVLCDRTDLLWEEHPDNYKPIEPVIAALERAEVATRVASLMPVVTVKR